MALLLSIRAGVAVCTISAAMMSASAHSQFPKFDKFAIGEPMRASARISVSPPMLQSDRLSDAATFFAHTLRARGYTEQAWFRVHLDDGATTGLAVLTRLERIDDDGRPVLQDRFSQEPFRLPVRSLSDYFARLLSRASVCHYRAFLFYLNTSGASQRVQEPATVGSIDNLFVAGSRFVPLLPSDIRMIAPYTFISYVYVWDRPPSSDLVFEPNSPIDAKAHLIAAGLGKDIGLQ